MNPNIPSTDPASAESLEGLLDISFKKNMQKVDGQLPCEVLSYNRFTNRATVRPLVDVVQTSGNLTPRAQYASVPVLALGDDQYCITFPLKRGSKGWIEASDRDISLMLQAMSSAPPGSYRIHSFSGGRFIPDAFAAYAFDDANDSGSMVLQKSDGSVKITLDPAKIRIIAATVQVTATTAINMTAGASSVVMNPAGVSITAPAISLNQTGGGAGSTFTGNPVVMPDAIINGVQQSIHKHANVTNGPNSTDGPH